MFDILIVLKNLQYFKKIEIIFTKRNNIYNKLHYKTKNY